VEPVCVTYGYGIYRWSGHMEVRGPMGLLDLDLRASALHILCNLHAISTILQIFLFVGEADVLDHHEGCEFSRECEEKNVCSEMEVRVMDGVTQHEKLVEDEILGDVSEI
jgi:hypothetical protein